MTSPPQPPSTEHVTCVVAGCGPAGAVLALMLARAGVQVLVLEKHADFLRDFRGDTVHPSTLRLMDELGLLDALERLPMRRAATVGGVTDDGRFTVADFSRLRPPYNYLGFLPQWDFLDLLAAQSRGLDTYTLRLRAQVTALERAGNRVTGLRYRDRRDDGGLGDEHVVTADLVVACDGRSSDVRRLAGLRPRAFEAPIDVLWFRISRVPGDPESAFGRLSRGRVVVLIDRGDYWQMGYVIAKDEAARVRARGLDELRAELARLVPAVADRVGELRTWDDVRLLTVQVDRLRRWWRPGLLCIGDAAHAMSPVGGVGINLAVQDAAAAANRLAVPLREGRLRDADLAAVQRRRTLPTIVTQTAQRGIQRGFLGKVLAGEAGGTTPRPLRVLDRFPALQIVPALAIGRGLLPEHARTPVAPVAGGGAGQRPSAAGRGESPAVR